MVKRIGLVGVLACGLFGAAATAEEPKAVPPLLTVAESSAFEQTGTGDDVDAFFTALTEQSDLVRTTSIGKTNEGRDIPLVVIADPPIDTAQAAQRSGKLIVLLIGNIHAGEVCGKEALQILARELAQGQHAELLDGVVLCLVPNYNADGNDVMDPRNRPGQVGPAKMGTRANAQGLDLNRDWVKMDAPETRAMVRFLSEWDPTVIVDTHTTNGSLHRYALTYQGPKHPAGDPALTAFVRDDMLATIDQAFEEATGHKTFFYGNFDAPHERWLTYPAEPRYGAAYRGLRNRITILSEAYAYSSYEERVRSTHAFCLEVLRYAATNADSLQKMVRDIDDRIEREGRDPTGAPELALRVETRAFDNRVTVHGYAQQPDEAGALAERDYEVLLVNDFVSAESVALPYAYLLPPELEPIAQHLQRHGIEVSILREDIELDVEAYGVTAFAHADQEYEGRTRVKTIEVETRARTQRAEAGMYVIHTAQPLGRLAAYMLEPRATDGLLAWGFLNEWTAPAGEVPVLRVPTVQPMTTRAARPLAEDREPARLLRYDDLHGRNRLDLDGDAVRPRWVDAEHYLLRKDNEWRVVHAATGRSEPYEHDTDTIADHIDEALPTINRDEARRIARRTFNNPDPDVPGAVFEHANDLYFATWTGEGAVRLTATPEEEELFELSPDGTFVGFVRESDLYVVDLPTRTERRLTTGGSPTLLHGKASWVYFEEVFGRSWKAWWWSPDSRSIAYLVTDESMVPEFIIVDDAKEPQRVERTRYPKPGQPNPRVGVSVVAVAGGTPQQADLSRYDTAASIIGWAGWSAQGKLRVAVMDRAQTWLDLMEFSAAAGEGERLFRETTGAWVSPPGDPLIGNVSASWTGGPQELSDGSFLWFSERDGWRHIYHYEPDGALRHRITAGEYEVRTVHFIDEEQGTLWFTGTADGSTQSHLYRIALRPDGDLATPQRLTPERGQHRTAMSPDGKLFIDTWSTLAQTPMVALRDASTGDRLRWIDTNPVYETEAVDLPRVDHITIEASEGVDLEAMIFYPPGFDPSATYPVWFMTYAGPHAPTVSDSWRGGWLNERLLATQGVVVMRGDPYPASAKGAISAWTAYQRLGERELRDIETMVNWLTDHPWADATRVGISGHSYGGFITAYAMTHSDTFSAGVSGAPVTSWRDYDTIYTERYMRTPQDNPDGYDATDVVAKAKDLHGNLLLLHGTMDDNVHMQNSIKLVDALRRAQKQFEVFVYPGFRHGIRNPHYHRLMFDFMLREMGVTERTGDGDAPQPQE